MNGTRATVDHFIPWWRYPTDLGHNFVLAHAECNRRKSDHLAAEAHLERWVERNRTFGGSLAAEFDGTRTRHDLGASLKIARWAYGQAHRRRGMTWVRGNVLEPLTGAWARLLEEGPRSP